jgi:hypothetical protein
MRCIISPETYRSRQDGNIRLFAQIAAISDFIPIPSISSLSDKRSVLQHIEYIPEDKTGDN